MKLSHVDASGTAQMVDVGDKDVTKRRAVASGLITTRPEVIDLIAEAGLPKGDALPVARIAAVMGGVLLVEIGSQQAQNTPDTARERKEATAR